MSYETIQLIADGQIYEGWTEITVTAAINQGVRTFDIEATEISDTWSPFPEFNFPPGTEVEVHATGTPLVKGYILEYQPSADATQHSITLTGTGQAFQYVNSSPKHDTGQFEEKSIKDIANELGKHLGITVEVDPAAMALAEEIIPWFRIRRGSTPWAEIMRLLPQRGLTMTGLADGTIQITKAKEKQHAGSLMQGYNIQSMSATLSIADRFKETAVTGQSSLGTSQEELEVEETAEDTEMPVPSYREDMEETETDSKRAKSHAENLKNRATGRSTQANIVTPSFRDEGGALWEPGWNIHVMASFLKLDEPMMIERVVFHQDDKSGTTATLTLVGAEAYGGESSGSGSGSGSGETPGGSLYNVY